MLTCLRGGHVIDPVNGIDHVGDIWFEDGKIIEQPQGRKADELLDVSGHVVMAGAIDIHSHIAGGGVNTARLLLPESHRAHTPRPKATPLSNAGWTTFETGRLYAQMGYTTVIEPAILPHHALHAHLELADIPVIDKGFLTVLGNDDFLLGAIRNRESESTLADYIGATLASTRAIGIKCANPGGVCACKQNLRSFSLDDEVPEYGVSARDIFTRLQRAIGVTGIPHPLHLHMSNLGLAGNIATALGTIEAAQGVPLHLAHAQFYAYGKEGKNGFSSAAAQFAAKINQNKNVTVDVGQVMFADTVTISTDVMKQLNSLPNGRPKKGVIFDGDSNGLGVVPYSYRISDFYNAVQWAAGLELFLLVTDPMQVFFTTDHPNGAPFTAYPEVFALLMSADRRAQWMSRLPAEVLEMTSLPSIKREYTLQEIAMMTRAAPRKLYGFKDRGELGAGSVADIAVYRPQKDNAAMFRNAAYLFKDGQLVVREGEVLHYRRGKTLFVRPDYDPDMNKRLDAYYDDLYGLPRSMFCVADDALPDRKFFREV
ncbi:formylmethanofuran dehydrogenase subunit A (plasmid) [Methylocystis sp. MJC1]|uniref:formylmethanofuran dehydrogenase subunit A n=1 Tax=Methylocystis sp. MJC1 TaxID=2654282 RepID=UPI0019D0B686|nr:formylmethanofuran dehydrogenase subunit A [Methylocystis sp. MJC1]KAF2988834.1 Formyltransferase/hydrolase complex Fhc subunit A [Methylocystis sp. MJC1]MBU6529393.1 formylmethanofuran dehydrogenase subunit A [Methylocystis sp. MJC1]UZX14128.1 formylmethanofuran dehydrogenase subunit A [Methylocystis sp. MJC1]